MSKQLNVVLQGGGVKGIAYVGALEALPGSIRLHAVGGTSAGAIVAALLAIGKKPDEILEIMRELNFSNLLDPAERARFNRLRALVAPLGATGGGRLSKSIKAVYGLGRAIVTLIRDVRYVFRQNGLHDSTQLKKWLDACFGTLTFSDIETTELYVVASDLSERALLVYSKKSHPHKRISEAVLASASIPLFFRPQREADRVLVDGGVLSNFPCHLFDGHEFPTVGLRLVSQNGRPTIDGLPSLATALLNTMMEAHDKDRTPVAHFTEFEIDTGSITATEFALSTQAQEQLLESGRAVGRRIQWEELASAVPVYKFRDARPLDVLQSSMVAMEAALNAAEQKSSWCDELYETVELDYFIDLDWTVRMEFTLTFAVRGSGSLQMRRFNLLDSPEHLSIVDIAPEVRMLAPQRGFSVHLVPWSAESRKRGFGLLLVPAVSQVTGTCSILIKVRIPGDQVKELRDMGRTRFPWSGRQRASTHLLDATFRFWKAGGLPDLAITPPPNWVAAVGSKSGDSSFVCLGGFRAALNFSGDCAASFEITKKA